MTIAAAPALAAFLLAAAVAQDQGPIMMDIPAISDQGYRFAGADFMGRYKVSAAPEPGELTLDRDGFIAWLKAEQSDRTLRDTQGAHGWLAEYSTADGRTFLWYPGNTRVIEGRWKVETKPATLGGRAFDIVEICFLYPGTYNELDDKSGDEWDCWPAAYEAENHKGRAARGRETRAGDVFGLTAGAVPYVLDGATKPLWPGEAPAGGD